MAKALNDRDNVELIDLLDGPSGDAAIVSRAGKISYGELRERALGVAALFAENGVKAGDRIAVMLPNGIDWLSTMFAASRLGVAVVSINIRLGAKELGDMLAATCPVAIVYDCETVDGLCVSTLEKVDASHAASVKALFRAGHADRRYRLGELPTADLSQSATLSTAALSPAGGGDWPCFIIGTSGTTGRSKIVVHAQAGVVRHVRDVAEMLGLRQDTSSLAAMPFSGAYGFTLVMSALAGRQTIVVAEAFDPVESGRLMRDHGITHMGGTNDMIYAMLQADDRRRPFPALHHFIHANFTPSLTEMPPEAERRGVCIRGGYGSSEMLALVAIQPADASLDARSQAGGVMASAGASFRIVDPDTREPVADGEIGEIEVHAPNGMLGYLDNPDANSAAITDDRFFRTGDLGFRTADGRMQFETRRNDVLRIGGYLVAPAEIEEMILQIGGIAACQVVAVQSGLKVRPVAFVIPDPGPPSEQDIIDFCRDRLAKYKVPVRVFSVEDFPAVNGPNGRKIKRSELRDLAQEWTEAGSTNGLVA